MTRMGPNIQKKGPVQKVLSRKRCALCNMQRTQEVDSRQGFRKAQLQIQYTHLCVANVIVYTQVWRTTMYIVRTLDRVCRQGSR